MVNGQPGTDVKLTLDRHGVSQTQTITRATISEPIVASSLRTVHGKKLGWVYLATFAEARRTRRFAQSVQKRCVAARVGSCSICAATAAGW